MGDEITNYLDSYEFRGDEGDYMPTAEERLLIEDAMRGFESEQIEALRAQVAEANGKLLVPGEMYCAKCSYSEIRTNLYVRNGTTGPGNSTTEPCPNGCGPLWPVTWEKSARDSWKTAEDMFERAHAAEAKLADCQARDLKAIELLKSIDLRPWTDCACEDCINNGEGYRDLLALLGDETTPETASATCEWYDDGGDMWVSGCGVVYTFNDGGPVENDHAFCIKCGKRVSVLSDDAPGHDRCA